MLALAVPVQADGIRIFVQRVGYLNAYVQIAAFTIRQGAFQENIFKAVHITIILLLRYDSQV